MDEQQTASTVECKADPSDGRIALCAHKGFMQLAKALAQIPFEPQPLDLSASDCGWTLAGSDAFLREPCRKGRAPFAKFIHGKRGRAR